VIFADRSRREREAAALEWISRRSRDESARAVSDQARAALLFAAGRRLHSAPALPQMLQLLQDVLARVVGCPEAALFEIAGDPPTPALTAYFGEWREALAPVAETIVRAATEKGHFVLFPDCDVADDDSTVCLPLRANGRPIGALVLFGFRARKAQLREADAQLLAVLSTLLASALRATGGPAPAIAGGS
jgi:GAF domain-containing protein